jgi:hypothetical protein
MTNPAYQTKRKRKRDMLFLNSIFGGNNGQGLNMEMSNLFAIGPNNDQMMNQPLLNQYFIFYLRNPLMGLMSP